MTLSWVKDAKEHVLATLFSHISKLAYYIWMYTRDFNETTNSTGVSMNSGSKETKSGMLEQAAQLISFQKHDRFLETMEAVLQQKFTRSAPSGKRGFNKK